MGTSIFGASVKRVEDRRFLTGQSQYVDDVRLPDTLGVAFVRSTHARAHIRSIDTEKAMAVPGVVRVMLGDLETPSPITVGGIKGMGEGGTVAPPAAIANAIADALAPFGWRAFERLPITPEVVRNTIAAA